jgi:hypothetical protein
MMNSKITLKLQSQTKTKRVRELPRNFEALLALAESQIKEEREATQQLNESFHKQNNASFLSGRDFSIKYVDGDQELINVSDDEDLMTAYDVAEKELNGNLKLTVALKPSLNQTFADLKLNPIPEQPFSLGSMTERIVSKPLEEKKEEVSAKAAEKEADALSKKALKKAMKAVAKE